MEEYSKLIKRLKVNETEWEYITQGKGEQTFLILPGGGQTAQVNFQLIEQFKDSYKVVAITIYDSASINDCCLAINKILNTENADKNIVLYGLSLGGLVAQSYLKRNLDKVNKAIFSHSCTPSSKTYKRKVINPLMVLNVFLPLIPNSLIKFFTRKFSGAIQGVKSGATDQNSRETSTIRYFGKEFYNIYLNKTLLKTWINLHLDFYQNERFIKSDYVKWDGKILILRSDDDPLMQDEGDFEKVYPNIAVHTFKDTGHLSYYHKFDETVKVITKFIS